MLNSQIQTNSPAIFSLIKFFYGFTIFHPFQRPRTGWIAARSSASVSNKGRMKVSSSAMQYTMRM